MADRSYSMRARRTTRIALRLPARLGYKDASGQYQMEDASTIVLNKHGARFECARLFELRQELLVVAPTTSRSGLGKVVWVDSKRNKTGNAEFAVELYKADNLWGVSFPPDDWQAPAGPQTATAVELPPTPSAAPQQSPAPSPPAAREPAPTPVAESRARPAATEDLTAELSVMELREELGMAEGAAAPETPPVLSRHLSPEMFPAMTAAVLNALVSLLERRGLMTREELNAEIQRLYEK